MCIESRVQRICFTGRVSESVSAKFEKLLFLKTEVERSPSPRVPVNTKNDRFFGLHFTGSANVQYLHINLVGNGQMHISAFNGCL